MVAEAINWVLIRLSEHAKQSGSTRKTRKVSSETKELIEACKSEYAQDHDQRLRSAVGLFLSIAAKFHDDWTSGRDIRDADAVLQLCEQMLSDLAEGSNGKLDRKQLTLALRSHIAGLMKVKVTQSETLNTLLNKLSINRFATLNYDTIVEQEMWKWVESGDSKNHVPTPFKRLASLATGGDPAFGNPRLDSIVAHTQPSGRSLRSAYLTDENMGELVNFALFPKEFDAQVFHLHGRVDAPESMVLSQRDYRRTYLKSGTSEELFETAVGAIFAANDVLFVGIGLNEPDPMRPLRRVMAQSWDRDLSRRHIVALLPNEAPNAIAFIRDVVKRPYYQSGIAGSLDHIKSEIDRISQASGKRQVGLASSPEFEDFAHNAKRSIGNFEKYGVLTIGYGSQNLVAQMLWLEVACQLKANDFNFGKHIPKPDEIKRLSGVNLSSSYEVAKNKEAVRAAILTQSLNDELERISLNQESWFEDWRTRPKPRESKFARYVLPDKPKNQVADRVSKNRQNSPLNFSRHRTVYEPFWSDYSVGQTSLAPDASSGEETINDIIEQFDKNRSIHRLARVVIRRGGGKGALLHLMQSRDPDLDRLVLDRFHPNRKELTQRYTSSFVVNLSYSIEFASVIDALIDFFQPNGASQTLGPVQSLEHRVLALRTAMKGASLGEGRRFICLSGVDRLCDARGLIRNGMYRRLFSTLTGKGLLDNDNWNQTLGGLKIDVLLISGREDRPPRYMSDEISKDEYESSSLIDRSEWLPVKSVDIYLRRWPVASSFSAKDCYWLGLSRLPGVALRKYYPTELKTWLDGKVAATTWYAHALRSKRPVDRPEYTRRVWGAVCRDDKYGLIRAVIEAYREDNPEQFPLAATCLRHLALYPIPVEIGVLVACPKLANDRASLRETLNILVKRGLVIRIRARQQPFSDAAKRQKWDERQCRYTLHHQIREYIARKNDLISPDHGDQFDYQVTLFCHQPVDIPSPKPEHFNWVREIVETQLNECRDVLWHLHQIKKYTNDLPSCSESLEYFNSNGRPGHSSLIATPQKLRATYAMLRGSFTLGAMLRLDEKFAEGSDIEPLDRMKGWLRGITNAATSLSEVRKVYDNATGGPTLVVPDPIRIPDPFYRDEIGWLVNERGVIALTQGNVFDALPLFENALEVMRHTPSIDGLDRHDTAYHASERRILLNRAVALLDHGNLDRAESELRKLVLSRFPGRNPGTQVGWISEGYLGLVKHLQGDLDAAGMAYEEVIKRAAHDGMLRVVSIFAKHAADLHRRLHQTEKAREFAIRAVDAAQNSEQRDLVWMARLTQVRLWLAGDRNLGITPLRIADDAIRYAEVMNLSRLRSEAMRLRAECLLQSGDAVTAGKAAMEAAATANRSGLRLMKVAAAMVFARSLEMRGRPTDAEAVLHATMREARRRRFDLYVGDIQNQIDGM